MRIGLLAIPLVACGQLAPSDATPDAASDAQVDAPFHCDPTVPFGDPVPLTELNTIASEWAFRLTPDELTAVFMRDDSIMLTTRTSPAAPFDAPTTVFVGKSPYWELIYPSITADGLAIFAPCLDKNALPSLCLMTRASRTDAFGPFSYVEYLCSTFDDVPPVSPMCFTFVTPDGERAYVQAAATPQPPSGVFIEEHNSLAGAFTLGAEVLASPATFAVSEDELAIYFTDATGTHAQVATRNALGDAFGTPTILDGLDGYEIDWVSPDQCRLYLTSLTGGETNVYVASRAQ